jgi:predicted lysophospholipase L1 biosynthesis ABC-type transport system permease subunit
MNATVKARFKVNPFMRLFYQVWSGQPVQLERIEEWYIKTWMIWIAMAAFVGFVIGREQGLIAFVLLCGLAAFFINHRLWPLGWASGLAGFIVSFAAGTFLAWLMEVVL